MKYKEFKRWCNDRACDGCWGKQEALLCIEVMNMMAKVPFWKRNKVWKKIAHIMLVEVVTPTNQKRQEIEAMQGW